MRLKWLLIVLVLVSACAKNRPADNWPASLAGLENFSEEQKQKVLTAIADLNTHAGKNLIEVNGNENGYPITIGFAHAPPENPNRAGFAIRDDETCHIDLSSFLFDGTRNDFLESVVYHELGHCAGLDHTQKQGDIMYPTTSRFATYSEETINSFISTVLAVIHLP